MQGADFTEQRLHLELVPDGLQRELGLFAPVNSNG